MKPRHRTRTRTGEVLSENERALRSMSNQRLENCLLGCSVSIGFRLFGIPRNSTPQTREYVLRAAELSSEQGLDAILHGAADFQSEYIRRGLELPDLGAVQAVINAYVAASFVLAFPPPGPESEVVH